MPQTFGGDWTEQKLKVVEDYLCAYLTIMRGNERARSFTTIYVDGFAGSGGRQERGSEQLPLAEDETSEATAFRLGSPLRAFSISPGFDRYIFMDLKIGNVRSLEEILRKDEIVTSRATVQHGDANILIPKWASS